MCREKRKQSNNTSQEETKMTLLQQQQYQVLKIIFRLSLYLTEDLVDNDEERESTRILCRLGLMLIRLLELNSFKHCCQHMTHIAYKKKVLYKHSIILVKTTQFTSIYRIIKLSQWIPTMGLFNTGICFNNSYHVQRIWLWIFMKINLAYGSIYFAD